MVIFFLNPDFLRDNMIYDISLIGFKQFIKKVGKVEKIV